MERTLLLVLALFPLAAGAQDAVRAPQVGATLIPATRSLQPGTPLQVAVRLRIPPGWHIYWKNPGASGLPTTIEWRGPAGFRAGPVEWPYPELKDLDGITVHAYEGEVILLSEIHSPASFTAPGRARIAARVSFGLCRDVCIAEDIEVAASLPVSVDTPRLDRRWARVAATAASRIPRMVPGWAVDARSGAGGVVLTVAPPAGAKIPEGPVTFFPDDRAIMSATTMGGQGVVGRRLILQLPFASDGATAPRRLHGVLVAKSGWEAADGNPAMRVDVMVEPLRKE